MLYLKILHVSPSLVTPTTTVGWVGKKKIFLLWNSWLYVFRACSSEICRECFEMHYLKDVKIPICVILSIQTFWIKHWNLKHYLHAYVWGHLWIALLLSGRRMIVKELRLFSLEKRRLWSFYLCLGILEGHKEVRASQGNQWQRRGSGHKSEHRKPDLNIGKKNSKKTVSVVEHWSRLLRVFVVFVLGDGQNPNGRDSG